MPNTGAFPRLISTHKGTLPPSKKYNMCFGRQHKYNASVIIILGPLGNVCGHFHRLCQRPSMCLDISEAALQLKKVFSKVLFFGTFGFVCLFVCLFLLFRVSLRVQGSAYWPVFTKSLRSLAVSLVTRTLMNSPTLHLYTGPIYRVILTG